VTTDAYLIGTTEVTLAQWMAFVDSLPAAERARRLPNAPPKIGVSGALHVEPAPAGWRFTFQPMARVYTAACGQPPHSTGRARHDVEDWRNFPVTGITADDAEAYAAWLRSTGRVPGARLCSEMEWERGARGADDRVYPSGNDANVDANFDQTYGRDLLGPDEVGSH